jgi:uncharacterized protein (DUF488 family)
MKFYTIGYGGREPKEFVDVLKQKGIRVIVDVRLRPHRAYIGSYVKAKSPEKGIQNLLATGGIEYISAPKLGNIFLGDTDWKERYQKLLDRKGDFLTKFLENLSSPFCLMCAEKSPTECHRFLIAEYLVNKGYEVEHVE